MSRDPGRPPLDPWDPSVRVSVSLPSKQLAAAEAQAKEYRQTVQDWIRQLVKEHSFPELKRNK
jgi:hypothetical protein